MSTSPVVRGHLARHLEDFAKAKDVARPAADSRPAEASSRSPGFTTPGFTASGFTAPAAEAAAPAEHPVPRQATAAPVGAPAAPTASSPQRTLLPPGSRIDRLV